MNKYHNRNRIISPIMTIHDILTLNILSSFLSSLSFFSSFLSLLLPFLSLSFLPLSSFFPLSLSVFSVFYREGRTLSHHPDVERYCARLSE